MLKLKLKYLTRLCKQRDCSKRALHQAELLQVYFKQALHAIKLSNTSHLNALHMKEWFEIKPMIHAGGQLWKFQRGANVSKYVKNFAFT